MIRAFIFSVFVLSSCINNKNIWPKISNVQDEKLEQKVSEILDKMTLEQKVGQMIQAEIRWLAKGDVQTYHLGSVLNGGGSYPQMNKFASVSDWVSLADSFWEESMAHQIPITWGVDAIHGHNNVYNATFFPHNIGLGATRDPSLVKRIGEITAKEIRVTGLDWNFAPVVAVARDDRWGRTYESFSENPDLVKLLGKASVEGLQGNLDGSHVYASAKHYIGDGGTDHGINTGNANLSEEELMRLHGQGYISALEAKAQSVMVSFNSFQGEKLHGHKYLITDVLKKQMGFDGLVVSDWNGAAHVKGCRADNCPQAVLAGIDLFMIPEKSNWKNFYFNLISQVNKGIVPLERINDAVTRILRVKFRTGLFDAPKPSERLWANDLQSLGSTEHRLVAREAARKSMVLLKNNNNILPLSPSKRVLVTGKSANKIENQLGGWSLSWQGSGHPNSDFPRAVSMWEGLKKSGQARFDETASNLKDIDVAIAVIGETPYAESDGDITGQETLEHSQRHPEDAEILRKLKAAKIPVVTVFLSGRPLYVNKELNMSDAFIASFLPGSEGGDALADLIFNKYDFSGNLSFSWPRSDCQTSLNVGDKNYDPLFRYGYGLSYQDQNFLPNLDESSPNKEKGCGVPQSNSDSIPIFARKINKNFSAFISDDTETRPVLEESVALKGISVRVADDYNGNQYAAKEISFHNEGSFYIKPKSRMDIAEGSLNFFVSSSAKETVEVKINCGKCKSVFVDVSPTWQQISIPLSKFSDDFSNVSEIFYMKGQGNFKITIAQISILSGRK